MAKFTNLRPAEAKPIEQLRQLHTPLYAKGEISTLLSAIVNAGLPAGIGLAAARIADPDFVARAEFAQAGDPAPAGSPLTPLGGLQLIEVARYLARADPEALLVEVRRGELMPAFAESIAAAAKEPPAPPGTIVQDDLLAMILVPGAFATYRRMLGKLLVLRRLVQGGGSSLADLLLPATAGMIDDLHGPWPGDEVPPPWLQLLRGRILLPAQIVVRPAAAPGAIPWSGGGRFDGVLAASGLATVDHRRFTAAVDAADAADATTASATAKAPASSAAKANKDKGA